MFKYLFVCLVSMAFISCNNVEEDWDQLTTEVCTAVATTTTKATPLHFIKSMQAKTTEIYKTHPEEIATVLADLQDQYSEASTDDIAKLFQKKLVIETIINCDTFREKVLTLSMQPYNAEKPSVKRVANKVCEFLEKAKKEVTSYEALDEKLNAQLMEIVFYNTADIKKDYGKILGSDFYKDLNGYLFEHCKLYFELTMIIEYKKM